MDLIFISKLQRIANVLYKNCPFYKFILLEKLEFF